MCFLILAFSATIMKAQTDCVISNEQTISVVSDPNIVLNGALTVCSGGTATLATTVLAGAGTCVIHWQSSLNGTLWNDIVGEAAISYTTPPLTQSTYYRALRICDASGCDTATSNIQLIQVVQDPQITTNPVGFSECLGGNIPLFITATGGTPTLLYQWQISTDSLLFTDIVGANAFDYIPNSTTIGTNFYRVIVSATGNGCGNDTSKIVKAIIVDDPIVTIVSNDYFICSSDYVNLSATVTGGTGTTVYQWQSSPDSLVWTNILGANLITYQAPPLSITTFFRLVVTQGSGCETFSAGLKIRVDNCNASIGNYVWVDCKDDGIQQGTETPLANVPVSLRGVQLDGLTVSKDTFTDASGFYLFTNLSPGRYVVIFSNPTTPTGITLTAKNQGADPTLDSDADPLTGVTDSITLATGENNLTIDAGFKDTTRPIVVAARDTSVQCDGFGNIADLNNFLAQHGFATATDNYSSTLTWTNNFSALSDSCGKTGSAYITFTVTDECNNRNTTRATFTIIDTIPPSVIAATDTIIDCDGLGNIAAINAWLANHGGGTASDVCSGGVIWTHNYAGLNTPICGNSASALVTFTATDSCGNPTTTTARITIRDITNPVLVNVPADVTVECSAVPTAALVTATDNCDAAPVVSMVQTRLDGGCADSYTLTRIWTVVDVCNNSSTASQVITVRDVTVPVLVDVPANITVECSAVPSIATVSATDNCDANVTVTSAEVRTDGPNCVDTYVLTRTWTATDNCGNTSTGSQVITVRDVTVPVLVDVPANITVECSAVPSIATVSATDNCDANVTVTSTQSRADGSCADSYILTRIWTATDNCGNTSTGSQVIVVQDVTAPVLVDVPANLTVECSTVPAIATVSATDNCDPSVTVTSTQSRADGSCADSYILTRIWTATDNCGNTSTGSQVIVVQDVTAPVLVDVPANLTVECSTVPPIATVSATDNCDPSVSVTSTQSRADGSCADSYILTRIWTATDNCGNTSTGSQVIVVQDVTAPVLVDVPANLTVECSTVPPIATVSATDNCDPSVSVTSTQSRADGSCADSYTLTRIWTATDNCGNTSTGSQVIVVQDVTAPVLVDVPANLTVECSTVPPIDRKSTRLNSSHLDLSRMPSSA